MISIYVMDISRLYENSYYERAYALSDSRRQKKADALKITADKCRCIGAGLLLSYALRQRNIQLKDVKIEYNEAGKPYLRGEGLPFYNLSHSGNLVACVIGDEEVGVDIQKVVPCNLKVARRFFHEEEVKLLENIQDEQERELEFSKLFAMKESYAKCMGIRAVFVLNQRVDHDGETKTNWYYVSSNTKLDRYSIMTDAKTDMNSISTETKTERNAIVEDNGRYVLVVTKKCRRINQPSEPAK